MHPCLHHSSVGLGDRPLLHCRPHHHRHESSSRWIIRSKGNTRSLTPVPTVSEKLPLTCSRRRVQGSSWPIAMGPLSSKKPGAGLASWPRIWPPRKASSRQPLTYSAPLAEPPTFSSTISAWATLDPLKNF